MIYLRPNGEFVCKSSPHTATVEDFEKSGGYDTVNCVERGGEFERYIPFASAGLDDSEGDEIYEGHIINFQDEDNTNYIVGWQLDRFLIFTDNGFLELAGYVGEIKIIGHALTDPELVPDSFDVAEYFDLEVD